MATASADDDGRLLPYYNKLKHDELHIFARTGGAIGSIVLGPWARRIAVDYLKSASTVKPFGPNGLPSVFVNDSALKDIIRDALLVHGVAVSQHERETNGGWSRVRRGSPGNLGDFEGMIFEFAAGASEVSTASQLAVHVTQSATSGTNDYTFALALVNGTLRRIAVAQVTADAAAHAVDSVVCQHTVREVLVSDSLEGQFPAVYRALLRIMERATGVQLRPVTKLSFGAGNAAAETHISRIKPLLRASHAASAAFDLAEFPLACCSISCLIDESGVLNPSESCNKGAFTISRLDLRDVVRLDGAAVEALDIVDRKSGGSGATTAAAAGGSDASSAAGTATSLLGWLNRTMTGMGGRLMRQYLLQPIRSVEGITRRQSIVEALAAATITRDRLRQQVLRHLTDLDRLNRRLQKGTASLKEMHGLNNFILVVPQVIDILRGFTGSNAEHGKLLVDEFVSPLTDICKHLGTLRTLLESTIMIDGNSPRINPEFDDDLFTLDQQLKELTDATDAEARRVMDKYGWNEKLLKRDVATNGGHLFRVSRKEDKPVRDHPKVFRIFSTSKEGVKFATAELDRISDDVKRVTAQYETRQKALQLKLVETVSTYVPLLDDAKELLAQLDVFAAWATVVAESREPMVRPAMVESAAKSDAVDRLELVGVRHPLVELRQGSFVANDVRLGGDDGGSLWIVTGPNMGGKSTLMRSVGVAVVLAHAGCFVPAAAATITVRDAVLCRVGAVDFMTQGLSTFMVEMLESSTILGAASSSSLVIVDELGRGTSTFDGFGLAWAIAEELAVKTGCQSLFASHFHELSELADRHPARVHNVHVTAETTTPSEATGWTPGLRFLYKLAPGASLRSYGVHVAELAGMPAGVVADAREKAGELEAFRTHEVERQPGSSSPSGGMLGSVLHADERTRLLGAVRGIKVADHASQDALAAYMNTIQEVSTRATA